MHATVASIINALRTRGLLGIAEQVCCRRGVTVADLCGRGRTRAVSRARHELWWTLRNQPGHHFSLAEIGSLFGRDHATVHHGIHAHGARLTQSNARNDLNR